MRLSLKQDFIMKVKEQAASYEVQRKRITYQDYLNLPEDGKRHEVINGELVMTPAPNIFHQTVTNNIEFELNQRVELAGIAKSLVIKGFEISLENIFSLE